MYSNKEKLHYFQRLQNSDVAEHDLALLAKKQESNIDKYSRSPRRYADEILYALLDIFPVSIIVKNRREWARHTEDATQTDAKVDGAKAATQTDAKVDGTEVPTPTDAKVDGIEVPTPTDAKVDGTEVPTPTDAKVDGTPTDTEGEGTEESPEDPKKK